MLRNQYPAQHLLVDSLPSDALDAGHACQPACPAVAISIVNWKGLPDTQACCESLTKLTYRNAQVLVSDNASGDGSAETLRASFPQFTHVSNNENLGFSGGNNAVIRRACAQGFKYVLLLNNDTVVDPDFLCAMVRAAEADPMIGMVGAKVYFASEPDVIWYAGGVINFSKVHPFAHVGEGDVDRRQHDLARETDWITGCCLLVRCELVRQVGLLDELFGYYCEDVDWCLRARRMGWKVWYEPRARVWHQIGRSARQARLPQSYYYRRNALLIARRNLSWRERVRFYYRTIRWVRRVDKSNPEKSSLVRGIVHGVLGLSGPASGIGAGWWNLLAAVVAQHLYRRTALKDAQS